MSKQIHFVVMYDTDSKQFIVEDETRYLDEQVWDTETKGWERVDNDVLYDANSTYNLAYDALIEAVRGVAIKEAN